MRYVSRSVSSAGPLLIRTARDIPALNKWADAVSTEQAQQNSSISNISNSVSVLSETVDDIQSSTSSSTTPAPNPTAFTMSEEPEIRDGVLYPLVTAEYTAPSPLSGFAGIFLGVSGYHGISAVVKIGQDNYTGAPGGSASFNVLLDRTGETVTFYAIPTTVVGLTVSNWSSCPSYQLTLNASVTAPVAPVNLTATTIEMGVLLGWTQNSELNLLGYNIYRNTSNSFTGATNIGQATTTLTGSPAFVDTTGNGGELYYYFVTAVNTAGLESLPSASAAGTVGIPFTYVGVWNSTATYNVGEEVFYSGDYWLAVANNINSPPSLTNAAWQLVGPTPGEIQASFANTIPTWNAYTAYVPYDEVQYDDFYWVCVAPNSNSVPSTSNANWQQVGTSPPPEPPVQPWNSTTAYTVGAEVTYTPTLSGTANAVSTATTVSQATRDNAWVNPGNALTDSSYATCTLYGTNNSVNSSYLLQITGFNFSGIPSGATPTGIAVSWKRAQTAGTSAVYDDVVSLLGLTGNVTNHAPAYPGGEWPSTPTVVQYGGADDVWGVMPTLSQFQSSSFGFEIGCQCTLEPGDGADIELNSVEATIYYATSGEGATNYYVCLVANTDEEPDISPTYWQLVGPATTDAVQNGALTALKVQNESNENMIQNPSALSGVVGQAAPGWTSSAPGGAVIATDTLPSGSSGPCIRMNAAAAFDSLYSNNFTFTLGQTYTYWAYVKTGGQGQWFMYGGPNNILQEAFGSPTVWTLVGPYQFTPSLTDPPSSYGFMQFVYFNAVADWIEVISAAAVMARNLDTQVVDGTMYQRTLAAYLASGVPFTLLGAWNSSTAYVKGADVTYDGNYWTALANNTDSAPSSSNANWQLIGPVNTDAISEGTENYFVNNGPGVSGLTGVSGSGSSAVATTGSVQTSAITGAVYTQTTSYVDITTSGTVASIDSISLPSGFSYVDIHIDGAIASTNSTAVGWAIDLYNASGTKLFGWDYQAFSTADVGASKYHPFGFDWLDEVGSTEYYFVVSTNSGGTVSLIPVNMIIKIAKR